MLPSVYIMTNHKRGTLYIGVTSNLAKRVYEHREGLTPGFTSQHGLKRLVWYEGFDHMPGAIAAEKRMKRWRREWKIELIEKENPEWRDLWFDLGPIPPSSQP
ncbi:MAG: GIY-YIG nuclease family protein [Pseudomonadota bacterium]